MNHQGQRWNVHYVANVGLRKRLNLCKRGFKIYDLLVFCMRPDPNSHSAKCRITQLIANEPAERRRSAGEAAENSAA